MNNHIRIVLVGTSHPGNIGAAARAMKTMGLSRLYLVEPQSFPHAEATSRASGADDLLAGARVCASLDEALSGCVVTVGTSARGRSLDLPELSPRQCAEQLAGRGDGDVALVFGRERSGLSNEELRLCQYRLQIPANPGYSSLNLAAAVQIAAYELRMAALAQDAGRTAAEQRTPAGFDSMQGFYAHLEETLLRIGYMHPDRPGLVMPRLRRLFDRAAPDQTEIDLLRGVLKAAQRGR